MNLTVDEMKKLAKDYAPLKQGYFQKEKVWKFAEEVAKKLNYNQDTDICEIVKKLKGKISYLDVPVWEMDGSVFIHKDRKFDIILLRYSSPLRNQFIIAHEIAHYFLHDPQEESYAARNQSNRCEWEANWFAAGFLMPEDEFKAQYKEEKHSVSLVASYFNVSTDAAEVRRNELNL